MIVKNGCSVFWAPYSVGAEIPYNAVVAGYKEGTGEKIFITRHVGGSYGDNFGNYREEADSGWYLENGAQSATSFELLVLI